MTTIYKYRVWCNADSRFETAWAETEPKVCPVNTNHTIDPSKTSVLDSLNPNIVSIKDEIVPTGGNYQCTTVEIIAEPFSDTIKDVTWPVPISVYSLFFIINNDHQGNIVNLYGIPPQPIGVIMAPVYIGAKTIKVSSTVLLYLQVGYIMIITDGINTDSLGMVYAIDKVNSVITTEKASTKNYSPLTPTYVKMCVHRVKDFILGPAQNYPIGKIKTVGSPIPPGLVVRAIYTNKTEKQLAFRTYVEYTY